MNGTRRWFGALVGTSVLSTAGCLGFIRGDESLAFEAGETSVPDEVLSETGYELVETDRPTITETFEVADQTREVEVTNDVSEYQRAVDLGPLGKHEAAVFVTFATPKVEILTRTFNPVGDMDNAELAEQLQSEYDDFSIGSTVDERTLSVLDDDVEVTKFEGEATLSEGTDVDVYVHLGTAEHEDDFVVVLGAYPTQLDGEEDRFDQLAESVEHEE